jgi:2'-5' RNA ligase
MPRLFVAIDVPDAIKDQLLALCAGVPGAKWVQRAQLHLTLRFVGEVESAKFQQIKAALGDVQSAPFSMTLRGVGQFPPKRAARVLWVGVDAPPTLNQLQAQVETTLSRLDFPPEERPFSAHLTLARLKTAPPPSAVESYLSRHAAFQSESFPITEFILYSSILSPQGPTYRREAVYPLL